MEWMLARPSTNREVLKKRSESSDQHTFAIVDEDHKYKGLISIDDVNSWDSAATAIDVLNECNQHENKFIFVDENEPLDQAKDKMKQKKLQFMPVIDSNNRFIGTIDRYST